MIHEFINSIPVVVIHENGGKMDGEAIYVRDGSTWNNDVWAIALCETGQVIHVLSDKIRIYRNATYGIAVKPSPVDYRVDPITGSPLANDKKEWNDLLVSEFVGYSKHFLTKHGAGYLPTILEQFKQNKNIK